MDISERMATDPLKQFIRQNLWEAYIKKLGKPKIKYLTLLCPYLMDVKYFSRNNYIELKDEQYVGVVGIIDKWEDRFSAIISNAPGRPEEILKGFPPHELIKRKEKKLLDQFFFDVINLDYCNFLFGDKENSQYLSGNLEDIIEIIGLPPKN